MDSFPRADGKMVLAFGTDLEVFIQLLVEHHRLALGVAALGPQSFGNLPFTRLAAAELGFFQKGGFGPGGWRRDGRLGGFNSPRLFSKGGRSHSWDQKLQLK